MHNMIIHAASQETGKRLPPIHAHFIRPHLKLYNSSREQDKKKPQESKKRRNILGRGYTYTIYILWSIGGHHQVSHGQ